jgi:hypothetical protein
MNGDAIVDIDGYYVNGRQRTQSNEKQEELFGRVIFKQPEWSWPGAFIHLANDAHGTERTNNCKLSQRVFLSTY